MAEPVCGSPWCLGFWGRGLLLGGGPCDSVSPCCGPWLRLCHSGTLARGWEGVTAFPGVGMEPKGGGKRGDGEVGAGWKGTPSTPGLS